MVCILFYIFKSPTCLRVEVEESGVQHHQPPPPPLCGEEITAGERPPPAQSPAGNISQNSQNQSREPEH